MPVRIALDPKEIQTHPLRVGLSTRVRVDLHDQSGPMLAAPAQETAATMPVRAERDAAVEALIARVIADNSTH